MNISDIKGARPRPKKELKNNGNNNLDYQDVTKMRKSHVRRFSTNPLDPKYESNGSKQSPKYMGFLVHSSNEEGAAPGCVDRAISKSTMETSRKTYGQSSPNSEPKVVKGKKRFDNRNQNMNSTKIKTYASAKPPTYKQTIKRWNY